MKTLTPLNHAIKRVPKPQELHTREYYLCYLLYDGERPPTAAPIVVRYDSKTRQFEEQDGTRYEWADFEVVFTLPLRCKEERALRAKRKPSANAKG